MASNKNTHKKLSKNKLLSMKQKLIKSIGRCGGCSECRKSHEELYKINVLLRIPSNAPDFSYLDRNKSNA